MTETLLTPTERARRRRRTGTVADFDGQRLSLARRRARLPRTALSERIQISAAAITQFERGASKPTQIVVGELALALGVPADFFTSGRPMANLTPSSAHFRSLRATPAISRDQALAFAELALAVVDLLEQHVEFPDDTIPLYPQPDLLTREEASAVADRVRSDFGIPSGPVSHVVRVLESAGAAVLRLAPNLDARVDAFSTSAGSRPLVLLSLAKADRARSRFDAAHELGHLVMHPDTPPGSKFVEDAAHKFAAEFLAPSEQLQVDLPRKTDWDQLQVAKAKWGLSLKSLAYRAHALGIWGDTRYRNAMRYLQSQGYPEAGSIGAPEQPYLLGAAADLLAESGVSLDDLSVQSRWPIVTINEVITAGREERPKLRVVV